MNRENRSLLIWAAVLSLLSFAITSGIIEQTNFFDDTIFSTEELTPEVTEIPIEAATQTELPPAETESPPAETESPPAETESPPAETESPPVETESPPAETESPPIETPESTFADNLTSIFLEVVQSPEFLVFAFSTIIVGFYQVYKNYKQNNSKIYYRTFISYRRKGGSAFARSLYETLKNRNIDTFFDLEGLSKGRFSENLNREIRERENFILVLAPGTLESEWVIKETEYALELKRNIIPVTVDGFDIGTADFPDEIAVIKDFNAVRLDQSYFDASIDRIVSFLE